MILGLRSICALVLLVAAVMGVHAADAVRFAVYDVYIDPQGEPLAAYQISLSAPESEVKLVSIEGGEHKAFAEPPYYDPAAIQKSRVILAAFSTSPESGLPRGMVRVASLHVQITGDGNPAFKVEMKKAGNAETQMIPVRVVVQERISTD